MSSPIGTPGLGNGGFNLTQSPDTSQSIAINYLPMGITGLMNDPQNYWLTALCSSSSNSNVTYTVNGKTTEYKANKLWVVGSAAGSQNPLHNVAVPGATIVGELFIQNFDINGANPLYMCYLLAVTSDSGLTGQIDSMFQATASSPPQSTITVDLNADINAKASSSDTYIVYNSTNVSSGAPVVVLTRPIFITSVALFVLQNNVGLFDMSPTPLTQYAIIPTTAPGTWMECDNVPIGSDEVTTLSLPTGSGMITDIAAFGSFRVIIMFLVFFFICVLAYLVVPVAYLSLARYCINVSVSRIQNCTNIRNMEVIISVVLLVLSIILIGIGAFSSSQNMPNANLGDILLSGFCILMLYIMMYIVVQSKKQNPDFMKNGVGRNYVCDPDSIRIKGTY